MTQAEDRRGREQAVSGIDDCAAGGKGNAVGSGNPGRHV